MWLQDFLPKQYKDMRIMTYRYNSRLAGEANSDNKLIDFKREFCGNICILLLVRVLRAGAREFCITLSGLEERYAKRKWGARNSGRNFCC